MALIAMAHEIPTSRPRPSLSCATSRQGRAAMALRGARYLHVLVPCPLGWGAASADTIRVARLARRPGCSPSSRRSTARSRGVSTDPRSASPSRSTCAPAALRPPLRRRAATTTSPASRRSPTATSSARAAAARGRVSGEPVRDHARRRVEPGQPDRRVARRAARLRRPPAAVQRRLPGRREHPGAGCTKPRRGTTRRLGAALVEDNPLPAIMGRVCYHPCETACNRGQLDEAVGIHAVERFLGDAAIAARLAAAARRAARRGKRVLVVGSGPSRALRRLSPRAAGHGSSSARRRRPGGMMRYGIPKLSAAPRGARRGDRGGSLDLGVEHRARRARRRRRSRTMARGRLRRGVPGRRRAHRPSARRSRPTTRPACWTRSPCCAAWKTASGRCSAAASSSTAAATPRWTPPGPPSASAPSDAMIVYRRTREQMPAHASEVAGGARRGRARCKWLSTDQATSTASTLSVERWSSTTTGFPQPTGEFETLEADSLVLALGQDADLSLLDGVARREVADGVVEVDAQHDDRLPGHLRRRRHGARRADRHRRRRPRQAGGAQHRRLARGATAPARARHESSASSAEHLVLRRRPADRRSRRWTRVRRQSTFEEVQRGLDETNALFEARRCLSCGNCFECDNCYGVCPDNAVIKLGPASGYEFDSTTARAAASAPPSARAARSRWSPSRAESGGAPQGRLAARPPAVRPIAARPIAARPSIARPVAPTPAAAAFPAAPGQRRRHRRRRGRPIGGSRTE